MTDPLSLLSAVIRAVSPKVDAAAWSSVLAAPMRSSGITTPTRIAMFVGQVAVESAGFGALAESLYYTSAERIVDVFGRTHFADATEATPFVGRPQALANRVYANRNGNRDEESGDGWRFRGRGLIQVTGRTLYAAFAKVENRAWDPDWLSTPAGAAESASWYWTLPFPRPSLNALSDAGDANAIIAVTRRINGGLLGLTERASGFWTAMAVMDPAGLPTRILHAPESQADRLMDAELQHLNTAPGQS